jgi:hypothetical protein
VTESQGQGIGRDLALSGLATPPKKESLFLSLSLSLSLYVCNPLLWVWLQAARAELSRY